jgi:hypothetical protein
VSNEIDWTIWSPNASRDDEATRDEWADEIRRKVKRPGDSFYTLSGDSFVYGWMDSEGTLYVEDTIVRRRAAIDWHSDSPVPEGDAEKVARLTADLATATARADNLAGDVADLTARLAAETAARVRAEGES